MSKRGRPRKIKRAPAEEVAILARKAGMSYGKYVASHDVSHITDLKPTPKYICRKCGAEIYCAHKVRKVCDECKAKAERERYARDQERLRLRREALKNGKHS
jgi:hypothetical protein